MHEYYLYILDENDEIADETTLQIGDKIESWTTLLDLDDPSVVWLTTMEDSLRTITQEPRFSYEHLTPNVDFHNELTLNKIDFPTIDLNLILWGYYEDPVTGRERVKYSPLKDMQIKWNGQTVTAVKNWFLLWF